jgi:hypothetical protein
VTLALLGPQSFEGPPMALHALTVVVDQQVTAVRVSTALRGRLPNVVWAPTGGTLYPTGVMAVPPNGGPAVRVERTAKAPPPPMSAKVTTPDRTSRCVRPGRDSVGQMNSCEYSVNRT